MNPAQMENHGGPEPGGMAAQRGQQMPSEQEIMMAGMIALGLMPPPGQGQPGQPPMEGQPMPGGGGANSRIAQQLMMK